jgi:hypothetical protein
MFGRTLNDLKDYTTDSEAPVPISLDDWKEHQEKIMSLIYPAISDKVRSGKDKLIKSLNQHRRLLLPSSFPVGSTVMITDVTRQTKFEPKYVGPYSIVRRSRGGAYVLKDSTGDLLDRKIPADQMKLISKSQRKLDIEKPAYEVERIISHRGSPANYEYFVHWLNYPEEDRSWVPASDFLDDKIIRDYWEKIKNSPQA